MKQNVIPAVDERSSRALKLDQELQPLLRGIHGHLYAILPNERDRELLGIYGILQMGSGMSLFSPAELISNDHLLIFTTWAKKAESLLQVTTTRKRQSKTIR